MSAPPAEVRVVKVERDPGSNTDTITCQAARAGTVWGVVTSMTFLRRAGLTATGDVFAIQLPEMEGL